MYVYACFMILRADFTETIFRFHEIFDLDQVNIEKVVKYILGPLLKREPGGGVNLAGKVENLYLVSIGVYRLENRKFEVCLVSGGGGPMGDWGPRERQVS